MYFPDISDIGARRRQLKKAVLRFPLLLQATCTIVADELTMSRTSQVTGLPRNRRVGP